LREQAVNGIGKYIGLDETIAILVADGRGGEVRYLGEIAPTTEAFEAGAATGQGRSAPFVLLRSRYGRVPRVPAVAWAQAGMLA